MTIDATVANQYELSETAAALEAVGASASFLAQFTATSGYTVERVELAALRIDGALTLDPACGGERSMQRRHRAASLDAIEAELAPIPHRCELGPAPDAVSPGARSSADTRQVAAAVATIAAAAAAVAAVAAAATRPGVRAYDAARAAVSRALGSRAGSCAQRLGQPGPAWLRVTGVSRHGRHAGLLAVARRRGSRPDAHTGAGGGVGSFSTVVTRLGSEALHALARIFEVSCGVLGASQ